ncbi:MAG: hypothetical protein ABI862_16600 [Ilumatobacteraceae bacterium]
MIALPSASAPPPGQITDVHGQIVAIPRTTGPGVYSLRILFNFVPQGLSDISAKDARIRHGAGTIELRNDGRHSGDADFYQWIAGDPAGDTDNAEIADIIDVGAQAFPGDLVLGPGFENDRFIVLAVNQSSESSTQATHEYDGLVDTNGDGVTDFVIVTADSGVLQGAEATGVLLTVVFDAAGAVVDAWDASAPMNSSTLFIPFLASDIGVDGTAGGFSIEFHGSTIVENSPGEDVVAAGSFDPFNPAVSTGDFVTIDGKGRATVAVTADRTRSPKGWLVVTVDDKGGRNEAQRVRADFR